MGYLPVCKDITALPRSTNEKFSHGNLEEEEVEENEGEKK